MDDEAVRRLAKRQTEASSALEQGVTVEELRRRQRDQVVQGNGDVVLHEHGRQLMRLAFLDLSDAARQMGMDEDAITDLHGRFFDGNVEVKEAVRRLHRLANPGVEFLNG